MILIEQADWSKPNLRIIDIFHRESHLHTHTQTNKQSYTRGFTIYNNTKLMCTFMAVQIAKIDLCVESKLKSYIISAPVLFIWLSQYTPALITRTSIILMIYNSRNKRKIHKRKIHQSNYCWCIDNNTQMNIFQLDLEILFQD